MGAFGLAFAIAQLGKAQISRKPIDVRVLQNLTGMLPPQVPDAGAAIRSMRDSDRY